MLATIENQQFPPLLVFFFVLQFDIVFPLQV